MPRRKRTGKRRAEPLAQLDGADRVTLLAGWQPPEGEHERSGTKLRTIEDVRAAWEIHRDDGFLQPDQYGRRAWGWWECEAPEPRDPRISEFGQLVRLDLLTKENIRRLRSRFDDEMKRYEASDDKEFGAVEEGEALDVLDLLSEEEQRVVRSTKREHEEDEKRWEEEERRNEQEHRGDQPGPTHEAIDRGDVDQRSARSPRPHLERGRAMQEAIEERFTNAEYTREVRRLGIENEPFRPGESWTP